MGLYDRLMGTDPTIKASAHQIMAVINEFARGELTGTQARDAFTPPLDASEQAEGSTLVTEINLGNITPKELHDVMLMAGDNMPPYTTEASVKTRLGF